MEHQLRVLPLIALICVAALHCAHTGGDGQGEGTAEAEEVLVPPTDSSMAGGPEPLREHAGCLLEETRTPRPIELNLSLSFSETPEVISALFEGANDPAALGVRFLSEIEPLVEGCLTFADARPGDEPDGGQGASIEMSLEDERFAMTASILQPCMIGELGPIEGVLCLEVAHDEHGEMKILMGSRNLIVDGHGLGDASISLSPPDEQGILFAEVHISMDRLPRGWARGAEQMIERGLSPLVVTLETAARTLQGLFDFMLTILAHVLVDVMRAGGHSPN